MTKVECPTCGGSGFVSDSSGGASDEGTLRDRDQTTSDQDQTWDLLKTRRSREGA